MHFRQVTFQNAIALRIRILNPIKHGVIILGEKYVPIEAKN